MFYFAINLIVHLIITCFLVLFILRFAKANKQRKNTRGISFLLPLVFSVIFFLHAVTNTFPKLADSIPVFTETYQPLKEGEVESISLFNNSLVIDGIKYFYNPFAHKPEKGDVLQIYSTQHSHYIVKLLPVAGK